MMMQSTPTSLDLLTVGELANRLRVKPSWVYAHADEQPRQPNNRLAVTRYFARIPPPMQRKCATEKVRNGESHYGRGRDSQYRSTTEKECKGSSPASRGGMSSFQELLKKLEAIYIEHWKIMPTWIKKDFAGLARLRGQSRVPDSEIERHFRHYVESGDTFYKRNGYSLALFCSRFDAFAKAPPRMPEVEPDW